MFLQGKHLCYIHEKRLGECDINDLPRVSSSSIVVLLSVDSFIPSFFLPVIMLRPKIEESQLP